MARVRRLARKGFVSVSESCLQNGRNDVSKYAKQNLALRVLEAPSAWLSNPTPIELLVLLNGAMIGCFAQQGCYYPNQIHGGLILQRIELLGPHVEERWRYLTLFEYAQHRFDSVEQSFEFLYLYNNTWLASDDSAGGDLPGHLSIHASRPEEYRREYWKGVWKRPGMKYRLPPSYHVPTTTLQAFLYGMTHGLEWLGLEPLQDAKVVLESLESHSNDVYGDPWQAFRDQSLESLCHCVDWELPVFEPHQQPSHPLLGARDSAEESSNE